MSGSRCAEPILTTLSQRCGSEKGVNTYAPSLRLCLCLFALSVALINKDRGCVRASGAHGAHVTDQGVDLITRDALNQLNKQNIIFEKSNVLKRKHAEQDASGF